MSDQLILFILMHSKEDWQKVLGGSNVDEFLGWIWEEGKKSGSGDPQHWIEEKVTEFKA